jgi:O-acetyl-ADP-ribose deacetylase
MNEIFKAFGLNEMLLLLPCLLDRLPEGHLPYSTSVTSLPAQLSIEGNKMQTKITIKRGDITGEKVDAIVNAANRSLLGGGGVDGAIHDAAGPELLKECRSLGGCETGEAKMTAGYRLSAKFIIHTVGPVYGHARGREKDLLSNCYLNSLMLARAKDLRTIAFPCISTGVYGYPQDEAAKIAIGTVKGYVAENPDDFQEIFFVTFRESDYRIYESLIAGS